METSKSEAVHCWGSAANNMIKVRIQSPVARLRTIQSASSTTHDQVPSAMVVTSSSSVTSQLLVVNIYVPFYLSKTEEDLDDPLLKTWEWVRVTGPFFWCDLEDSSVWHFSTRTKSPRATASRWVFQYEFTHLITKILGFQVSWTLPLYRLHAIIDFRMSEYM